VGLDVSASELELAPLGSYDELWVRDVVQHEPELVERFDLILSWQVIEHVKPIKTAFDNLHSYLVPQGRLVALFSGAFSAFALINAIVPDRMGTWAMEKLLRRPPDTVFPAYYDHCWYSGLERVLAPWNRMEIVPLFRGAGYFGFSQPLQRMYLHFEEWARKGNHNNLATHYLVDGTR
jgi:hypothetical protein